ncbi:DUF3017 domain-containing protein [Corynebacterium maris]|uniref:DUF3017 domain-containing protein n=1 Tax=Corynebacterium maris TaxID=575200 RepID=UPI0005A00F44|nr:DUF3017 domain-containing protein [Corynebacterium maris]
MWWSVQKNSGDLSLDNPHDLDLPPSPLPRWVQWAGVLVFLALVVLSGGWALTEHWRRATFALGTSLLWLALVRQTCDSQVLGVFSVRSRRFDVIFCLATGGAMTWLAASVDALGS